MNSNIYRYLLTPSIILEFIKYFLKKNSFLYNLYLDYKQEKRPHLSIKKRRTKICIEGYPRSANSYAVRMFKISNQRNEHYVLHHSHSFNRIKKAIKNNIPVLVLIRNPEDAIASSLVFKSKRKQDKFSWFIRLEIRKYLDFYLPIFNYLDKILVVKFEDVISNYSEIIRRFNNYFGLSFNIPNDEQKARNKVLRDINMNSPHKNNSLKIPKPSENRAALLNELRKKVEEQPNFNKAQLCYNCLIELYYQKLIK